MAPKTHYLKNYCQPDYWVDEIDLVVQLYEDYAMVMARLSLRANDHIGDRPIVLNGDELELISISRDDLTLTTKDYYFEDQNLILSPPHATHTEINTVVRIRPQLNTKLMGLYKSRGNFCTQCEAEGFRRITYYIDRPDNLAIFTTTIVADKEKYPYLLSNGNCVDKGETEQGRHFATWRDPFRKGAHLFALVAGNFDVLTDEFITRSGRCVQLLLYVERGYLNQCDYAMKSLKLAMRWDEEIYGREYDLDIFMTVAVSDFTMGAMENKGLNIFNTKFILANPLTATDLDYENILRVVGHEYFHNWSGNRVGCRDWFQLSLKEGFTVFRDQNFTLDHTSTIKRIGEVNVMRTSQFVEDAGPMSHPIRPDAYIEINNFYTVTVYEKGAEVIRMLHTLLGPQLFRKATDLYFSRFDGQAVTTDDFVDCMQEASGIDLSQFRLWYSQSGTPVLTIRDEYDAAKKEYSLHISQHTPPTPNQMAKQALHIPVRFSLLNESGEFLGLDAQSSKEIVLPLKEVEQSFIFKNIPSSPVPSLLRGFSAPVKIVYPYTKQQLKILLTSETDAFIVFEAAQSLAIKQLKILIEQILAKTTIKIEPDFIELWRSVLLRKDLDLNLQAYLLTLPSETYIAEQMLLIEPMAIHEARQHLFTSLAEALQEDFAFLYHQLYQAGEYEQTNLANGKRALRNVCLSYLLQIDRFEYQEWAVKQYETANNMTDRYAALAGLVNQQAPKSESLLQDFYETFVEDALVIDKWFAVQAQAGLATTFDRVKTLLKHPQFSLKNPNRARSVLLTFSRANPGCFHRQDGKGYILLADQVLLLDAINPLLASRLVEPLTHWRRYAAPYSELMHTELKRIMQNKKLSKDTEELVSKALL